MTTTALDRDGRPGVGAWVRSPVGVAVVGFLAVSGALLLLGRLAAPHQLGLARQEFEPGLGWFGQWVRWDGNWYFHIATGGYDFTSGPQEAYAFWPAYPMAIRLLERLTGDAYDAGLAITWLSGFAFVVLVARWASERMSRDAAVATVVTLLLLPYAWYLHWSVYGEALFALCAIAAFLLYERDHPVLAGVVGAVATAGRPMGLAVAIGLVGLVLERRDALVLVEAPDGSGALRRAAAWLRLPRGLVWSRLRAVDAGVLLSVLGAASFMFFLWRATGDPLRFAAAQDAPGWANTPGPRTWFKLALVDRVRDVVADRETAGMLLQGALSVGALCLVPRVVRRFGWGYGLYCLVLVGVPVVSSKDFYGLGRYILPAFPVVAVVGEWLAGLRPRWRGVAWGASTVLLAYLAYTYARGAYVA